MIYKDLLKFNPYDYQVEGANFALSSYYCLIADDMGLGKTIQALMVAVQEALKGKKTLIVCPAFLRLNWQHEIEKCFNYYHYVTVLEKKVDVLTFDPRACISIISYHAIKDSEALFDWADIVICDEAHYLKEIETSWTIKAHKFIYESMPERLILLTGTPIQNGVTEFYSLLRLLSYNPRNTNGKDVYEDYPTPESFYRTFAYERNFDVRTKRGRSISITRYEGLKNKDLLKTYLRGKYIRRKAEDVLDLPDLIDVPVIADYKENKKLEEAFNKFNSKEEKGYDPAVKAKSALMKAPFTIQYAKNIHESGQGPVLIYTDHIASCEEIATKLGCPMIMGSTPMKKRDELKNQFQRGELDYLACTIGAGAEGLTLTAACHMIFNDYNWVPAKNKQVKKRFHRIGQTKKCTCHIIIGSKQDEKIIKTLIKKEKVIGEVV